MTGPQSRYALCETAAESLDGPDGPRQVRYLRRRFLPPPDAAPPLGTHQVARGDRVDLLADRYFGDPELYWRICDANPLIHPDELVERIGTRIVVPHPLP